MGFLLRKVWYPYRFCGFLFRTLLMTHKQAQSTVLSNVTMFTVKTKKIFEPRKIVQRAAQISEILIFLEVKVCCFLWRKDCRLH
jgi:hypothetical protein